MTDLFTEHLDNNIQIAEDAYLLRGFALPVADKLWGFLTQHFKQFPPRQMMTPMGYPMSVKTTSVGQFGWVGTPQGYDYSSVELTSQKNWPAMPSTFLQLAQSAAERAGHMHFLPDTCLVNLYAIGTKMGLHRDQDELDFSQPIVSVSLGIPATFLFGGTKRTDKTKKIPLTHGDVVVWGGASRRFYHGIQPIKPNRHALLDDVRCNLTFRKAR